MMGVGGVWWDVLGCGWSAVGFPGVNNNTKQRLASGHETLLESKFVVQVHTSTWQPGSPAEW